MMGRIMRFNRKSRLIVGLSALAIIETPPDATTRELWAMVGKVVLAGFGVGTLQ